MDNISNLKVSVKTILKNNNLTELSFGNYDELNDPPYIIWFDNNGQPYDDPVIKITCKDTELSIQVEAREFGDNVTLEEYEIDRLEWWQGIHASLLEILGRDGKRRCPACGKPLPDRQKYCSDTCRQLAAPQPTVQEITLLANQRIRQLIDRIAGPNQELKNQLIQQYSIARTN